jgi:hypothetical protein
VVLEVLSPEILLLAVVVVEPADTQVLVVEGVTHCWRVSLAPAAAAVVAVLEPEN